MSRLSVNINYQKKLAEIIALIEKEAQNLQKVLDKKDLILFEIKELTNRKTTLIKGIADLEQSIKEKGNSLNQLVARRTSFLSSIKKETDKEKKSLKEIKNNLNKTIKEFDSLNTVASELNNFIKKETELRSKFIKQQKKLNTAKRKNKEIITETQKELAFISKKNKEFDKYKQYLIDFYGKVASYVKSAKETVEYVNTFLKKNEIPIEFDLPPGEVIKIDIDNFDKKA